MLLVRYEGIRNKICNIQGVGHKARVLIQAFKKIIIFFY